jgi:transglutaminase-like putative cysteine protease
VSGFALPRPFRRGAGGPPPPGTPPPGAGPPGAPPGAAAAHHHPRLELPLRLVAFFALATFCAAHYSVLVSDADGKRVVGLVAVATLGAAALALTGRTARPRPRAARAALRIAIAAATLAGSLVVTGLAARLLLPAHWDELGAGLDRAFSGLDTFQWPYDGNDPWVRLTLLLGMPLLVAPAAVLAFWPARRAAPAMRWLALALLLVAYGTGVTQLSLGGWALRGSALLVVMAAWLWLPRLRPRDTAPAALAVLACGLLALPLAAGFDRDAPWIDYQSWNWFERDEAATGFAWDHSYGPIGWSRSGVKLLDVRSGEPHYWKAETLDRFDGVRWLHSESANKRGGAADDIPLPMNPRWVEHISFTIAGLQTPVVVGAGTTFSVDSGKVSADEPDGTIRVLDPPLQQGASYAVDAYVPDPTAAEMRGAPPTYPGHLAAYTIFDLPSARDSGLHQGEPTSFERSQLTTDRTLQPSGPGGTLAPADERRVLASPYGRAYELARRLGAGQPTTYDTVKATERYLQGGGRYQYSEKPPARRYPLAAFLFDDKIGYCQQFSGAMALLLRMDGIPARVAAGFAPGVYDHQAKEYRVRDYDAHSWVEVWFTGIGWVPFDPTPSAAPASSQSDSARAASAARGATADHGASGPNTSHDRAPAGAAASASGDGGGGGDGSGPWLLLPAAVVLVPLALALVLLSALVRRRPHRRGGAPAEGAVDELRAALRRLGHDYPERTTLTELERRLRVTAGPAAARYASLLREQRYARPGAAAGPTPRDRRELRRALTRGGGLRARLRGLLALPPELTAR